MYIKPQVYSSYQKNNLGLDIYNTIISLRPQKVVEFGILHGYSTLCIAQALRDLNLGGTLISYDLFDEFEYRHGSKKEAEELITKHNLQDTVTIKYGDFYKWSENPDKFDLLHLDIANNGDVIKFASEQFENKHILFEGGSEERDKESWMKKYKKTSMYPLKDEVNYEIINKKWPSISLIKGKNVTI